MRTLENQLGRKVTQKDDKQASSIIGRNWLVSELYLAGIEVARPERDHGIDLIAFLISTRAVGSSPVRSR